MLRYVLMIIGFVLGYVCGKFFEWLKEEKKVDKVEVLRKRLEIYQKLLFAWVTLKQDGINLEQFFNNNSYNKIAIYGMGDAGERLIEELRNSDIEISYIIDRNADKIVSEFPKKKPTDDLDNVDAIVVSAVFAYHEIEEELSKKVDCHIISLEDVIYGLL